MKSITLLLAALSIFLVSCTTPTIPQLTKQFVFTPIASKSVQPATFLEPTSTLPQTRTIWFQDNFDATNLNTKWNVLEGKPEIKAQDILSTGKEKITIQIDETYPSDFTIQFDINQCGNDGYFQLTIGNQIQFELLSDLTTHQSLYQDNRWVELPQGTIHRCAAHIAILIKSSSYIMLNVHNDEIIKILEGKTDKNLNGPIALSITPYALVDNFLITSP